MDWTQIALTAIGAVVTIATAYFASTGQLTKKGRQDRKARKEKEKSK